MSQFAQRGDLNPGGDLNRETLLFLIQAILLFLAYPVIIDSEL